MQVTFGFAGKPFLFQVFLDGFQVERFQGAGVVPDFFHVRIYRVLPYLVRNQRDFYAFCRFPVVFVEVGFFGIEYALSAYPAFVCPLGNEEVVFRFGLCAMPLLEGECGGGIQVAVILPFHVAHKCVQELEVGLQLVACAQHAKRRMVSIRRNDAVELLVEETVGGGVLSYRK